MKTKRLLWQIYPSYLLIILVSLAAIIWYFSTALRGFYLQQTAADLESRAHLVADQVRDHFDVGKAVYLEGLAQKLGEKSGTRLTFILPEGKVLADSMEDASRMENHAERPEIADALQGHVGSATRYSRTLQQHMMYVALPVAEKGRICGVVRTAMSLKAIDQVLSGIYLKVVFGGLGAIVLAALSSLLVSRRISYPLEEMKQGAESFARGEFGKKLKEKGSEEICSLARTMNQMAVQLDDRIRTVVNQRNEQEAVLASMVEGVLAVDTEKHLIRLNQAAADLLGLSLENDLGKPIQEVIRKADLQRFVSNALLSKEPIEGEIVFRQEGERFLQAHGTALCDAQGVEIGALIVLNDVTHLRRLENVRRDFVANVSHELKTPITAIKGFVETLMDGAVKEPKAAQRFLQIISRQAERLNAIIEDLLNLSRIEQDEEQKTIVLEEGPLIDVLLSARQSCVVNAETKSVKLDLSCPKDLKTRMNGPLLEQAIVNLIDNAIKYSDTGGEVRIEGDRGENEIIIRVQDQGCGISQEHLSRLFERFYRVDKARSRTLGGTGLGLSIVKHIVQIHGGQVSVTSTPGKGSTFKVVLPV